MADNFWDIKKPVGIILDNLITKKCAKFQVDRMKIVLFMLPADLKNTVLRKTRHSRHFEKKTTKFFVFDIPSNMYNKNLWSNFIKKNFRV